MVPVYVDLQDLISGIPKLVERCLCIFDVVLAKRGHRRFDGLKKILSSESFYRFYKNLKLIKRGRV